MSNILWNENISCHINKQEMKQPSAISGLQRWMRAPKTNCDLCDPVDVVGPPPRVPAPQLLRSWQNARSKVNNETGLAPESWCAYERNELSEYRGLLLLIHRKPSSLPWSLIFDVQTACFLCCKLVGSLTSPPASWEQFSQSYWDAVSQVLSPKLDHQIK